MGTTYTLVLWQEQWGAPLATIDFDKSYDFEQLDCWRRVPSDMLPDPCNDTWQDRNHTSDPAELLAAINRQLEQLGDEQPRYPRQWRLARAFCMAVLEAHGTHPPLCLYLTACT